MILDKLLPKKTKRGRLARCVSNFLWLKILWFRHKILNAYKRYLFNKRVTPLLNPDILDNKIKYIQQIAKNPELPKEILLIKERNTHGGLCADILHYFSTLAYVIAIGKTPVIDMQNKPSPYLDKEKLGKENAWEYYFKQPCGYGIADTGNQKYRYIGEYGGKSLPVKMTGNEPYYDVWYNTWATIYRSFLCLNGTTQKYIDDEYKNLIKPGMRVLGVNCRGADYLTAFGRGHPIQPDINMLVETVKNKMTCWNCEYIYLATPEKRNFDIFNNKFPGKVLRCNGLDYDNTDFNSQGITSVTFDRPDDAFLRGLEYLTTIVILSRCTSAVLSITSGALVARYMNDGKYENVYVFDLGNYPV